MITPTDHPALSDDMAPRLSGELHRMLALAVVISMPFAFGVYWLRQLPLGPAARPADAVLQVELVRSAATVAPPAVAPVAPAARVALATDSVPHNAPAPDLTASPALPTSAPPKFDSGQKPSRPAARSAPGDLAIRFQKTLLSHFERYRQYPLAALARRLQGEVLVVFAMQRDGRLLEVKVRTSSGEPVLDGAALETIRRAQPLPPIPPELPDRMSILIPIAFDPP
jgi:protein TonB